MLTSEHVIVKYERGQAIPDRLTRGTHAHYTGYARAMLDVYTRGIGQTRRSLQRSIEGIFKDEPDCPPRRIAAFCKLLDEVSTYHVSPKAWELRLKVFRAAAPKHPLVWKAEGMFEYQHQKVKQEIAQSFGRSWREIEDELYADVIQFQRLKTFKGYNGPEALLSRYNVAQLQGSLYRATEVMVRVTEDFKTILRYVKLARLLHRIKRVGPDAYVLELTGPASELLKTRRYGVNFAKMLPAILSCRGWELFARLVTPWDGRAHLHLTDKDGFSGSLPAPEDFDSTVEEKFAAKFGKSREGWTLIHEGTILHRNQKTFVPDFLFRHEDGTEVPMEIVGFWTPEYLEEKRKTLQVFTDTRILLVVQEGNLAIPDQDERSQIVTYKTAIQLKPIMTALEEIRKSTPSD